MLDNLHAFLVLADCGTLRDAAQQLNSSSATLGRKILQLEEEVGLKLFDRLPAGYTLTPDGKRMRDQLDPFQTAFAGFEQWLQSTTRRPQVRLSAGSWTMKFLQRHIKDLQRAEDNFDLLFVSSEARLSIKKREIDIGLRSTQAHEAGLVSKRLTTTSFAPYVHADKTQVTDMPWLSVSPEFAQTSSIRWVLANHLEHITTFVSAPHNLIDLVEAGAGIAVLPCFVGDTNPLLNRYGPPIAELSGEQWIILHEERRNLPEVRLMADRITKLVQSNRGLYRGDQPSDHEAAEVNEV
ncbi:LysR family transcriptional regulator [Pseudovibrio sp. WM33]|uniref:LysR family transcriptional regulator n=1 Tax=Pseudovibrio sp. WM33 TaxID=1735585 RepID=UPI001AD921DC|nr:LysR family transcriptional regulator [Pseudovibrio sp. WM33]